MTIDYIELEDTMPIPGLDINSVTAELALEAWGQELLYAEAMHVRGSIIYGNLESLIAGDVDLQDNAYAIASGKHVGSYRYMRFSVDSVGESVSLEVLRVSAASNPYRQSTIELALDAFDSIAATPCGLQALKLMRMALESEVDGKPAEGLITAPADVVAELEAYASAHGAPIIKHL